MRPLLLLSSHQYEVIGRLVARRGSSINHTCIKSPYSPLFRPLHFPSRCPTNSAKPLRVTSPISLLFGCRTFYYSPRQSDHPEQPTQGKPPSSPAPTLSDTSITNIDPSIIPDKQLPSHRAEQRWPLSKRLAKMVDRAQSDLILASQRLNNYTGTDYSGIETLRQKIQDQEQLVRTCRASLTRAKERYDAANAQQASSQKEVVGLLERKHSWSAPDLERYMSLIRSEHVNEQSVQAAKEERTAAERALEEARARLEKIERTQYREEQVWSDTIRRNSTWVTFGLMGLNILLLLANLVIIEPWRRRRLIREIRVALDERAGADAVASAITAATLGQPEVEKEIDAVVDLAAVPAEALEQYEGSDLHPAPPTSQDLGDVQAPVLAASPDLGESILSDADITSSGASSEPSPLAATTWKELFETYRRYLRDLFSERRIALRRVDLTTTALEGAAAGAAFMGLLFVLLRPR